jgi:hypothetical protein
MKLVDGMTGKRNKTWWLMAAVVLAHLVVTVAHGTAHTGAHIPLSPAANVFVITVILAGPLIGLAVSWWAERLGAWLVALAMGGALVFGFLNHFVFASPDQVLQVDPQWRVLFTITAVLLAFTEALGFGLAIRSARYRNQ